MRIKAKSTIIMLFYFFTYLITISSSLPSSFSKERYSKFLDIFFKSLQGSYITPQMKVTSNQNITLIIDNIKSFTPLLINSTVSNYSLNDFIISNITIPFIFDILIEIENNINAIHILKSNCFFEITIKDIVFNLDNHITAKLPSIFNINEENVIIKAPHSITMFSLLEFITSKKDFSKIIINEILYPKMNQILTTQFNLMNVDMFILFDELINSLQNVVINDFSTQFPQYYNFTLDRILLNRSNIVTYVDTNTVCLKDITFEHRVDKDSKGDTPFNYGFIDVELLNISYGYINFDKDSVFCELASFSDEELGKFLFEMIIEKFLNISEQYYYIEK